MDFSIADEVGRQRVGLHMALDNTLGVLWNEIKYKAEVIKDYGDIPGVECLSGEINQVFLNLLLNAVQAIEERGGITIKTYGEAGRVCIQIGDTGSGMAAGNLNRLFDPFFTIKEPGKGTGLGLYVAYNVVRKHGGMISVESTLGEGTVFTVTLPVALKPLKPEY